MKILLLIGLLTSGCLDTSVGQCIARRSDVIGDKIVADYTHKIIYNDSWKFVTKQTDNYTKYYYGIRVSNRYFSYRAFFYTNVKCPEGKAEAPPYAPDLYKEFEK